MFSSAQRVRTYGEFVILMKIWGIGVHDWIRVVPSKLILTWFIIVFVKAYRKPVDSIPHFDALPLTSTLCIIATFLPLCLSISSFLEFVLYVLSS